VGRVALLIFPFSTSKVLLYLGCGPWLIQVLADPWDPSNQNFLSSLRTLTYVAEQTFDLTRYGAVTVNGRVMPLPIISGYQRC